MAHPLDSCRAKIARAEKCGWQAGDTIPRGADRSLRITETRFEDEDPVLVVEHA